MEPDISIVDVLARLVAAFLLIGGLLGGAVYVFRRRGMVRVPGASTPRPALRVIARERVSRSSSVAVVRVGTGAYLVGVTDASVTMLADVTEQAGDDLDVPAEGHDANEIAHQGTGAHAGSGPQPARMDLVGAILQRMSRRA